MIRLEKRESTMNDTERCHFSSNTGMCTALQSTYCNGFDDKCSFYKTDLEFIKAVNDAVIVNRQKGNCNKCQYRTGECKLEQIGDEYYE